MVERVNPGIHPAVQHKLMGFYSDDEQEIIKKIGKEWYVTTGGELSIGLTSNYRYILIKPIEIYSEMFNIEREIIAIFSPYSNFEPRTLDAIDNVSKKYQQFRLEKIFSVLISKDNDIENKIRDLLKNEQESQIIIPFSYAELLKTYDSYYIRNRFKNNSYTRDLFAFQAPLKKDLYFFGRNDLVHKIANRHKSNENSGLFGLRKTGKTSVIFGIERTLSKEGSKSVFIDCQNPAFHQRNWNQALQYIILEIKKQNSIILNTTLEEKYTEKDAPICFEKDILDIYKSLNKKNILIIFDEIENITFRISPSNHWAKGMDFIYFWQTMRSLFQKFDNVFSYLIVGTNPICIETPIINEKDNPIFNQVPYEYIPGFDVPQTREMVRKLGRIMGLKFEEIIYGKLTEDFGGHPFLIRHVCSVINKIASNERPIVVGKILYENAKEIFLREYSSYIEMILTVLKDFYDDEYEMIKLLARGDTETFNEFAKMSLYYTNHLKGYGLIEQNNDNYAFKTEIIRKIIWEKEKFKKIQTTREEMLTEISGRRNKLEPKLRKIIRNQMMAIYGKGEAKDKIINILGNRNKEKHKALSYDELLDPNISDIYFDDLRKIISKNWDVFKNIFGNDLEDFNLKLKAINKYRSDAHAKKLEKGEMEYFRVCITNIEKMVDDFLE